MLYHVIPSVEPQKYSHRTGQYRTHRRFSLEERTVALVACTWVARTQNRSNSSSITQTLRRLPFVWRYPDIVFCVFIRSSFTARQRSSCLGVNQNYRTLVFCKKKFCSSSQCPGERLWQGTGDYRWEHIQFRPSKFHTAKVSPWSCGG